ncbi:uncharacterized protein CEXT_438531 [Caerostris extrusa]|uniref:Uncharacterized protein n=1 Tax=Caerostris extrusa TaxID=172846 RepID=A0AAV4U6B3_CAEEX|nr:uncharacterized protein CEXT_438531 [Caerostris extrusa]
MKVKSSESEVLIIENKKVSESKENQRVQNLNETKQVQNNAKIGYENRQISKISQNQKPLISNELPRPSILDLKNGGTCKKITRKNSLTRKTGSCGKADFNAKARSPRTSKKRSKNTELRSISDSQIKHCNKALKKNFSAEATSHKSGLSRQEAFIVKSKSQLKSHSNQLLKSEIKTERNFKKSHAHRLVEKEIAASPLRKSQSVTIGTKNENQVGKTVTTKTTRKGSLIRGRPNTLKTGLNCESRDDSSANMTPRSRKKKTLINSNAKNEAIQQNES